MTAPHQAKVKHPMIHDAQTPNVTMTAYEADGLAQGSDAIDEAAPSLGLGFLASSRLALDHRFGYQDRDVMIIFQTSELGVSSDVDVDDEGLYIIHVLHLLMPLIAFHFNHSQTVEHNITNSRTIKLFTSCHHVFSRRSVRAKERYDRR